jgi:hypothetical protein
LQRLLSLGDSGDDTNENNVVMLRANRLRELSSTMQAKLGCSPPAKTVTAANSPRNRQVRLTFASAFPHR